MRRRLTVSILSLTLLLFASLAPQRSRAEIPFVSEELKVQAPYGETTVTLYHNTRTPHEFSQPLIQFSDGSGVTAADTRAAEAFATHGAWVVLLDDKVLRSRLADEAQLAEFLETLAAAIKGKMSEAMGPRLKGMPERKWPVTFGGRGTGAVRACEAAIKHQGHGVRGVLLIDPASEAPALGKEKATIVLIERVPKLGVTPVAILAPAETEELHALDEAIPGFSAIRQTPGEGLSFVSMRYQIRHQVAPRKRAPAYNPAVLFNPGP